MALSIHNSMTYYEVKQTLQKMLPLALMILYVSPERLETELLKNICLLNQPDCSR